MFLHFLKMVILPDRVDQFLTLYRESHSPVFCDQPSHRGTYLFEDFYNPRQFFILRRWSDLPGFETSLQSESHRGFRARSQRLSIERDRSYVISRTRADPRPFVSISASTGAARLVMLTEPPDKRGVFTDLFDTFTDEHARPQPGCRSIELYHQASSPHRVWVFGLYRTSGDLEAWLHNPLIFTLRENAQAHVYERMESWDMHLRIDDRQSPLSEQTMALVTVPEARE